MSTSDPWKQIALVFQITDCMELAEPKVHNIAGEREEQQQGHVLAGIHVHSWKYYQDWECCWQPSKCPYTSWFDLINLSIYKSISQIQFILMGLPWSDAKLCQTKDRKGPVVHMSTAEQVPVSITWHQPL